MTAPLSPDNPFARRRPAPAPADGLSPDNPFAGGARPGTAQAPVTDEVTEAERQLAAELFRAEPIAAPSLSPSDVVKITAPMRGDETIGVAEPRSELPALARGWMQGVRGSNWQMLGNTMQVAGEALDLDPVTRAGRRLERAGDVNARRFAGDVPQAKDVDGLASALDYAGQTVGQGLASMVPSIAGAVAAGPVGAAIPSYILATGEARQELDELGALENKNTIAALLGVPIAALDLITPMSVASRLRKAGVAEAAVEGLTKRILRAAGRDALSEGLTEAAQEATLYAGARIPTGNPLDLGAALPRVAEAGLAGALTGGAVGGVTGLSHPGPVVVSPQETRDEVLEATTPLEAVEQPDVAESPISASPEAATVSAPLSPDNPFAPEAAAPVAEPVAEAPVAPAPVPELGAENRKTPEPVAPAEGSPFADELDAIVAPAPAEDVESAAGPAGAVLEALLANPPTLQQGSRYTDTDVDFGESVGGAWGTYEEAIGAKAQLDSGLNAKKKKLKPAERDQLTQGIERAKNLWAGTLNEIRDAWGPDVADAVANAAAEVMGPLPEVAAPEPAASPPADKAKLVPHRREDGSVQWTAEPVEEARETPPEPRVKVTRASIVPRPDGGFDAFEHESPSLSPDNPFATDEQKAEPRPGHVAGPGSYQGIPIESEFTYRGERYAKLTNGSRVIIRPSGGREFVDATNFEERRLRAIMESGAPAERQQAMEDLAAMFDGIAATREFRKDVREGARQKAAELRAELGKQLDQEAGRRAQQRADERVAEAESEARAPLPVAAPRPVVGEVGDLVRRAIDAGAETLEAEAREKAPTRDEDVFEVQKQGRGWVVHRNGEGWLLTLDRSAAEAEAKRLNDRQFAGLPIAESATMQRLLEAEEAEEAEALAPGGATPTIEAGGATPEEADDATVRDAVPGESGERGSRAVSRDEGERDAGDDGPGAGRAGAEPVRGPAGRDGEAGSRTEDRAGAGAAPAGDRERGPGDRGGRAARRAGDADELTGRNYRLTDADRLGEGSARVKARLNLNAIQLLQEIEARGTPATVAEQSLLAQYVGWGGLPGAFDPKHKDYLPELKDLLSAEEYAAARRSTLNAHYTSPTVIRGIYDALSRLGVTDARALEPSMGVGNFLGLAPEAVIRSWSGVELDRVTGRIAKLLYPESDVRVQGFEKAEFADGSMDLIVSNVPFGDYKVHDPRYDKLKLSIHNYFFAKALDLVRPGGIVAFVTSRYTLDSAEPKFRAYVAERAELLGAIRLPETTFQGNAGTQVVTDLIILQRKGEGVEATGETFGKLVEVAAAGGQMVPVNEYFARHPEQMLGTLELTRGMFRENEPSWTTAKGFDLPAALAGAVEALPAGRYTPLAPDAPGTRAEADAEVAIEAPGELREGNFGVVEGRVMRRERGRMVPAKVPAAQVEKVKALIELRDGYRATMGIQMDPDASDAVVERERKALEKRYDAFVKKYGPIMKEVRTETSRLNKRGEPIVTVRLPNLGHFTDDPDWHLVSALERYDSETGKFEKSDLLTHRMLFADKPVESVASAADALPVVLAERGKVDLARIAQLAGVTQDEAVAALDGVIYETPEGTWETADAYLSGNVRRKLIEAREAAKKHPRFRRHVEALEAVQPEDLPPSLIEVRLGTPWIPADDVAQFITDVFGGSNNRVTHIPSEALWTVNADWRAKESAASTTGFGTPRISGIELLDHALNSKQVVISDRQSDGSYKKNDSATLDAQAKLQELKDRFAAWVWEDHARAARLARFYNDHFNNLRLREYDGSHLTLPGAATSRKGKPFKLRKHQLDAVWRILQSGNTLLAHVVGSGKTFTMVAAAMEAKRLGLARKPMQVVPNHMLAQFSREFLELYPTARLLVATEKDFAKDRRKAFTAKIASNEWDAVIMTHRSFEAIKVSTEFEASFVQTQLDELEAAIREQKAASGDRLTIKQLENSLAKREERLERLKAEKKKDDLLPFEALGVDMLFVDEAHEFKNLEIVSKDRGLGIEGSQRAFDLFMKSAYLDRLNPGRGLVLATGTPIANSVSEMFTVQRYMQPRTLQEHGLGHFDSWKEAFGNTVTALELAPDGQSYRVGTRFASFTNVPELIQMFRSFADVKLAEDLNLPTPPVLGGKAEIVVVPGSPELRAYVGELAERAVAAKGKRAEKGADNMLKITTDGRHAAMDMRLVDAGARDHAESKVAVVADRVYEIWQESKALRGTQMVFSDISAPGSDPSGARGGLPGFNVYDELKRLLVARGVPAKEIAFMHDATNNEQKGKLFQSVREGRVRVLMGSTQKMGAGTNVQDRLVAKHDMDAPWRPADVEQRDGRIVRQGNLLYESEQIPGVRVIRYVTEGSFDAYMWQGLERKDKMIRQVMRGDLSVRTIEDVDASPLSAAEVKALASGNPLIMEKAGVDAEVAKLARAEKAHRDQQFAIRQEILAIPGKQRAWEDKAERVAKDRARLVDTHGDQFSIVVDGKTLTKRTEAAEALKAALDKFLAQVAGAIERRQEIQAVRIGRFAGLDLWLHPQMASVGRARMGLQGESTYSRDVSAADSPAGLVQGLEAIPGRLEREEAGAREEAALLDKKRRDLDALSSKVFEKADALAAALARQKEINAQLSEKADPGLGRRFLEDESGAGPNPFDTLAKRLAERRARQDPLVTSRIDEVEERLQRADGLPVESLRTKALRAIEQLKHARRHFPEFEGRDSPLAARMEELLLEVEHGPTWARVMAAGQVADVVQGLSKAEVGVVARALALPDILKDMDAGLYDEHSLPFGYPDRAAVEADLADVQAVVDGSPKLQTALQRRRAFTKALTERLVSLDQLPEAVLEDERYYHRQVLEYYNANRSTVTPAGPRDVRVKQKGFQRSRTGGGDFNLAYHEAEFEWVAQAYQIIQITEALDEVKAQADLSAALKAEAKTLNRSTFEQVMESRKGTGAAAEALAPFQQAIARGRGGILRLLEQGELDLPPQFAHLEAAYIDAVDARKAEPRRKRGEGPKPPLRFQHRDWWKLLAYLAGREGPGSMEARTIFKAIADRDALVKDTLGERYATWEDLIPEGYRAWQPEKGMQFYRALTIGERTVDELLAKTAELQPKDVQQALASAGLKPSWVLPEWLANTMDNLGRERVQSGVEKTWVALIRGWKVWQLLNPSRALRYNANNLSGDADAAVLYPGIFRGVPTAARDLWAWMGKGGLQGPTRSEMDALVRRRVLDQGLTIAEIPDLTSVKQFEQLARRDNLGFLRFVGLYWDHARNLTQMRENLLRLSAYRFFLGQLKAGRTGLYGASDRSVIDALTSAEDKAARLARDLLGDYGRISHGGTYVRDRVLPFYSWLEINAKRYLNLARNIPHEAEGPGGRVVGGARLAGAIGANVGIRVGVQAARAAILANLFLAATAAWNHLLWPDEEDELRRRNRDMHLILGRRADGSIRTLRVEGAFADFLEWVALADYPADVRDLLDGSSDLRTKLEEGVIAPLERIVLAWEPISKTGFEVATKRALYPTPFKPRVIRDRGEHVARGLSLAWLYRTVTDLPTPPGAGVEGILLYRTDPGEAAYFHIRTLAGEWQAEQGKDRSFPDPTERDNALYYWKKAEQWGQPERARRWLDRYYALGGTPGRARASVKRAAPLNMLSAGDRGRFLRTLSPEEREALQLAERWYRDTYRTVRPGPRRAVR